MGNNNLLYLMGIQWNWIKQRPHYIAEGLAERYNLVTLSKKEINRRKRQRAGDNGHSGHHRED